MSRYCCVVGCHNRVGRENVRFFCFPSRRNPVQAELWRKAVNRVNVDGSAWKQCLNSRICSSHFVSGKFSHDKSDVDYVPSVNMDLTCHHALTNKLKGEYCVVEGCDNKQQRDTHVQFFSFPLKKNPDQAEKWRLALNLDPTWQPRHRSVICSAHFVSGKFSRTKKNVDYVPTIFPPKDAKSEIKKEPTCELKCYKAKAMRKIESPEKKEPPKKMIKIEPEETMKEDFTPVTEILPKLPECSDNSLLYFMDSNGTVIVQSSLSSSDMNSMMFMAKSERGKEINDFVHYEYPDTFKADGVQKSSKVSLISSKNVDLKLVKVKTEPGEPAKKVNKVVHFHYEALDPIKTD